MKDVMLDLETMGNGPCAAIIAVGAVAFDGVSQRGVRTVHQNKFYEVVSLESAMAAGGVVDASTILWWMEQSESARSAFTGDAASRAKPLPEVLAAFSRWLNDVSWGYPDKVRVWGCGAAFDNVILRSAYRAVHSPAPWKHWNDRCYRTIRELRPDIQLSRIGTHHNARDDAESQAIHLMKIFEAMEGQTT